MSYRSDARRQQQPRQQRPASKPDPDSCPPGYDPDIWHLTLLCHQLAAREGITLQHGRILTYVMLEHRVAWLKETLRQAAGTPVSHDTWWSAGGDRQVGSWQELAEAVIRREWDQYWQDEYSAEFMTTEHRFAQMADEVRHHGYSLRLVRLHAQQQAAADA